jgi:hypothetical protein
MNFESTSLLTAIAYLPLVDTAATEIAPESDDAPEPAPGPAFGVPSHWAHNCNPSKNKTAAIHGWTGHRWTHVKLKKQTTMACPAARSSADPALHLAGTSSTNSNKVPVNFWSLSVPPVMLSRNKTPNVARFGPAAQKPASIWGEPL